MSGITMRAFRDGDEAAAARLFNKSLAGFVGPAPTTPQSWRKQHEVSWRSPVLSKDPECFRFAERGGEVIAYVVVECPCQFEKDLAVIQELCVTREQDGEEVARLLIADAEQLARRRGVTAVVLHLSHEDGLTCRLAAAASYEMPGPGTSVFMATITNLDAFLGEAEEELAARLLSSRSKDWLGIIEITCAGQSAKLLLADGRVRVARTDEGSSFAAEITPEALPLLLFGRMSVQQAFLQDRLSVAGDGRAAALAVLDALFPCLPMYLPSSQWW